MKKTVVDNQQALETLMSADAGLSQRFAVRFVSAGPSQWRWLLSLLVERTTVLYLSEACHNRDTVPDVQLIIEKLTNSTQSVTVVGVSELLRLFPTERTRLLMSFLMRLQNGASNSRHRRVYVPLLTAGDALLAGYTTSNYEPLEDEEAALWVLQPTAQEHTPLSLRVLPKTLSSNGRVYEGVSTWFKDLESGSTPFQATLRTDRVSLIKAQSDAVVQVEVVDRVYTLLQRLLPNLPEEGLGSNSQWQLLLQAVSSMPITTLEDGLSSLLPRRATKRNAVLEQWKELTSDQQWAAWLLLKWWTSSAPSDEEYLNKVIHDCDNPSLLIEHAVCAILEYSTQQLTSPNIHKQRNDLLSLLGIKKLSDIFWDRIAEIPANQRFTYLSFASVEERCYTIELVRTLSLTLQQIHGNGEISTWFPALHAYATPADYSDPWLNNYFDALRLSKLYNMIQPTIKQAMEQWPSKLMQFPSRFDELMNKGAQTALVHYHDSLGIEWVPMLKTIISNYIPDIDILTLEARAALPSTTGYNQPKGFNFDMFDDKRLDELNHEKNDYPLFFVKQLELIQEYALIAARAADKNETLLLTADHGSSRIAILNHKETERLPEGFEPEYLGRYAKGSHPIKGVGWVTESDFLARLDHKRFSCQGSYGCENHGGATPEEVLVPVLRLTKAAIRLLDWSKEVRWQGNFPIIWTILLDRQISIAEAKVLANTYKAEIVNGKKAVFQLTGLRPGKHRVNLSFTMLDGTTVPQEIILCVNGGIEENDEMGL